LLIPSRNNLDSSGETKEFFMFKSNRFTQNCVLAIAALIISPSAWGAGGNAGGYQGPALNPTSMNVDLERGIRLSQVKAVLRTCLILGDPNTGLVSLAERFTNSFRKTPYSNFRLKAETIYLHRGDRFDPVNFVLGGFGVVNGDGVSNDSQVGTRLVYRDKVIRTDLVIAIGGPNGFALPDGTKLVELQTRNGFPTVTAESLVTANIYDPKFKTLIAEDFLLKNVSIVLPGDYGPAVTLMNADTHKETPWLTINMVEYVQCLQGQLQARAE
jgi:hypothetical protein